MAKNDILARLRTLLTVDSADFQKGLSQAAKSIEGFTSGIKNIAGTIGVAFGTQQVASFAFEVAKLAGEAEGVRAAFEKLPNSIALMENLKGATAGTVSELDLMKRTVQAANFGISLEALPKLLEFAAVRAQQTGQSVDYLVDSIVTGIGRKSPLILDNLGISAVALKEKMGGVALATADIGTVAEAVGQIASDELVKMGNLAETTAVKTQRLSASWDNLKVAIGNVINQSGALDKTLNMATNFANALAGEALTTGINQLMANMGKSSEILEKFAASGGKIDLSWQELMARGFLRNEEAAKKYEKILARISEEQKNLALANAASVDPLTGLPSDGGTPFKKEEIVAQVSTLESLREKLKLLNDDFEAINETDRKSLTVKGNEIIATQKLIDELEKLRRAKKEVAESEMQTKFGRDTLNQEAQGIGINGKEFKMPGVGDSPDTSSLFDIKVQQPDVSPIIYAWSLVDKKFQDSSIIAKASLAEIATAIQTTGQVNLENVDQMLAAKEIQDQAQADAVSKWQAQAAAAQEWGSVVGDALSGAISGQKNYVQVIASLLPKILGMLFAESAANTVAGAAKTKAPPPVILGLAAAGLAGISAIFRKIGASTSSVGSSASGSGSVGSNVSRVGPTQNTRVVFEPVTLRVQGRDLVSVLSNETSRSQVTG